jgi:hypothetical protein
MVSELFLQLLQYFMTNCELHLDFADWMEAQVCFCLCPETVQKLYFKKIYVGKFEFLWKMSIEKFGFTNSKESVPPKKKKPKLTKRQETKFMTTKKSQNMCTNIIHNYMSLISINQGKSFISEGVNLKKILEYWVWPDQG